MICGAISIVAEVMSRKWLHILPLLTGIIVLFLAIKYQGDSSKLSGSVGLGIWVLMLGGLGSIVASVMGILKKGLFFQNARLSQGCLGEPFLSYTSKSKA